MQIVAISLCKLRIFPLTFSKKGVYFKAFALIGRRGITNIKPRAIALGYELLPLQGVRQQQTTLSLSGRKATADETKITFLSSSFYLPAF